MKFVIVVGGGIIGLSCAWRMAQRGRSVTVFDARETGQEASWAGAGMLAPGGETGDDPAFARMALASLSQYPAFVEELRETSGAGIEFGFCGALEVAFTAEEAEAMERKAAYQAAMGIQSERAAFRDAASARFYPGDAVVNPRDVMAALKVACIRAGVVLREHEAVEEILDHGGGVRTAQGEYRDDGVLIASGAWSAGSFPVRGHLIGYPTAPIRHILRHGHTYLIPREGRLIAGSSTERVGFKREIDDEIVADIRRRAERLLPELADVEPSEVWIGFRPGLDSKLPCVGRVPGTSIFHAFGHYRNGILLAPETARMVTASLETD